MEDCLNNNRVGEVSYTKHGTKAIIVNYINYPNRNSWGNSHRWRGTTNAAPNAQYPHEDGRQA